MFGFGMMRYGTDAARFADGEKVWSNHPMALWMNNNSGLFWVHGILALVTWLAVLAVLVALARWLWKKGNKEK